MPLPEWPLGIPHSDPPPPAKEQARKDALIMQERREDYIPETTAMHDLIGARIKKIRKVQGLNKGALAKKAGLRHKDVNRIEETLSINHGFVHLFDVYEVAVALGVDYKTLLPSRGQILEALPEIAAALMRKLEELDMEQFDQNLKDNERNLSNLKDDVQRIDDGQKQLRDDIEGKGDQL